MEKNMYFIKKLDFGRKKVKYICVRTLRVLMPACRVACEVKNSVITI